MIDVRLPTALPHHRLSVVRGLWPRVSLPIYLSYYRQTDRMVSYRILSFSAARYHAKHTY